MSKKNKKKREISLYDLADMGIEILKSGKLRLKKGCTIDIRDLSRDAVDHTIGSRMQVLEDNSLVGNEKVNTLVANGNCCSVMRCYKMLTKMGTSDHIPTIVVPMTRKETYGALSYMDLNTIGSLLRISNLGTIYLAVKRNWMELLETSDGMDCVLYIPGITIFADEDLGSLIDKQNPKVNLLIYSTRKKKSYYDDEDLYDNKPKVEPEVELATNIVEAAVRLRCKELIIDPMSHPIFRKEIHDTADAWHMVIGQERAMTNLDSIDFCIEDDEDYIIFWQARRPRHMINS